MSLRVLIVDDEPLALSRLRVAFRAVPEAVIVGEARSGADALEQIEALRPDVVLLDVQMPDGNGVEVARRLQVRSDGPEVIFVTAFDSYAAIAFDLDASDYLLKPVHIDRLQAAIGRAERRREARQAGERIIELELVVQALRGQSNEAQPKTRYEDELWAPRPGGVARVPIQNVIWIEAARDYILVHTGHRSFILRETMNSLGDRLDPAVMLRVHRSAFVNKTRVDRIERFGRDGINLILANGAIVRVGATYKDAVLGALGTSIPNRRSDAGAK